MTGEGIWAALIRQRFDKVAAKFQLDREMSPLRSDLFVPPAPVGKAIPQLALF